MELFYSNQIQNGICKLSGDESWHCSKVLRHVSGDSINVIDGIGNLYQCTIIECGKELICSVNNVVENFGAHNYFLQMAVCPTKNIDRYEWFLEKATELGVDKIVPIIGEHSQRRIVKAERLEKILLSATKQSLKGKIPVLEEAVSVENFIKNTQSEDSIKLIAYCGELEKISIAQLVAQIKSSGVEHPNITVLIGPEGDFSKEEMDLAISMGYKPLTLGSSRLRTETAAVAAVCGIYFGL